VPPTTPQKVTLTLNADGSGNLSVVPFAGSGLAVGFPAGTVAIDSSSDAASLAQYNSPNGISIGFDLGFNGSLQLQGSLFAYNTNKGDYTNFQPLTLNG
jgi:hypothetical protein